MLTSDNNPSQVQLPADITLGRQLSFSISKLTANKFHICSEISNFFLVDFLTGDRLIISIHFSAFCPTGTEPNLTRSSKFGELIVTPSVATTRCGYMPALYAQQQYVTYFTKNTRNTLNATTSASDLLVTLKILLWKYANKDTAVTATALTSNDSN